MAEDPKDAERWEAVEEATELLAEERYNEALAELKKALDRDPKNAYAYYYTGVAMFEVGEMEPARDAYRAALTVAPRHLGARVALSHVLRKIGDYKAAIREGLVALEQAPTDGDAIYAVGMAYYSRGELGEAERYLSAFLATRPEFEIKVEVEALIARIREERRPEAANDTDGEDEDD
ncbi:MAG: tetratricopeptide repeat protein [Myxococcales bacterium]|jgi:tetratricopeptide (TPR) repeat protein|nr:tetratricopeptide repeat protein [Myxococcales bacterium]